MPPNEAGGHPAPQPDSRPYVGALTKARDSVIVRQSADNGARQARRAGRPLAFASQAAPCAGRTQWHLMYQCGACGGTHFGRSPAELTTGKRLARCGRVVWLIISRTYRARRDTGAAA